MTPEQRYLENENLVYFAIKKAFGSIPQADKKARNRHMSLADLEQVGKEQLWKCSMRFDDKNYIAFSTYAVPSIMWRMRRELNRHGHLVYIPRYQDEQNKEDRTMGVKTRYFSMMMTDEGKATLEDILPDYRTYNVGYKRVLFSQLLDLLSANERDVILLSLNGARQDEIATTLNIAQASVSRIIKRATTKMSRGAAV